MSLAVVSRSFYNRALVHWRTQTLDTLSLQPPKGRYDEHLDVYFLVRDNECIADKRLFRRSPLCLTCRLILQSDRTPAQQLRRCPQLTGALLATAKVWLQMCQANHCVRFQDRVGFENATLVAAGRIEIEDMEDPAF